MGCPGGYFVRGSCDELALGLGSGKDLTLRSLIDGSGGGVTWTSPNEPVGSDYFEFYPGLSPISSLHPPSLKNPRDVKVPTAQDGWRPGDSKAARAQAISDLIEIHKRLRRQIGKPEIAETANYPVYPSLFDWT
jgi:hypothetical protein